VRRRFPHLLIADDGNAAVEFALVAPLLILLLAASFEIAVLLFVGGTVESAVLAASRYGITGSTEEEGVSRDERIREIIADRTLGFVRAEAVDVRTLVYPSFDQIGRPEPFADVNHNGTRDPGEGFTDANGNGSWDEDMGVEGSGGPGDIVLYEIEYQTGAMTRLLEPIFGRIVLHAAVAVRNEPF
jgi:hypothetical protein